MAKQRRAFTQMGGEVRTVGDAAVGKQLAAALKVSKPGKGGVVRRLTHPFHTYPARMHPETARRLVSAFARPRDTLLDPFCGSGTVVLEGYVAGCRALGRDISPLAIRIAEVKTWRPQRGRLGNLEAEARAIYGTTLKRVKERSRSPGRIPSGHEFAPHVAQELAWLRVGVKAVRERDLRNALELCLSSTLTKVSRRASDTDPTHVEKQIAPGTAARQFHRRALDLSSQLAEMGRAVPGRTPRPDLAIEDARTLDGIAASKIAIIVTSPPYPNTYDYHDLQKLRLRWLGLRPGRFAAAEVGARRLFQNGRAGVRRWNRDGERWMRAASRVLRPGGWLVVFLGDGMVGKTVIRAEECLERWARKAGLDLVAAASQARPSLEFHMREAYTDSGRLEVLAALRAR